MQDPKIPDKIDPRILGAIVVVAIVGGFVIAGDNAVFSNHPPAPTILNKILGFFPGLFYLLLNDRMLALGLSGAVYLSILALIGWQAYKFILYKFLEPNMYKKMLEAKKREKDYVNKFGDETM